MTDQEKQHDWILLFGDWQRPRQVTFNITKTRQKRMTLNTRIYRLAKNRVQRIFWNNNLCFSFLPKILRNFSFFVGCSFSFACHGTSSIWWHIVGVAVQSLASKRSSKDPDGVKDKSRTNFNQRSWHTVAGFFDFMGLLGIGWLLLKYLIISHPDLRGKSKCQ